MKKKEMVVDRRDFIRNSVAVGAAATLFPGRILAGQESPNILFILVDQWRERCWFPEDCRIPGVERLRKEGLSFTNQFTSAVPCSPSRATLFTGLHLPQHGVQINVDFGLGGGGPGLDPGIPTLGHIFKQAGYRTPYFGKWHLTERHDYKKAGLSAYGFEEWSGPDRDGAPLEGLLVDSKFADQAVNWLEQNSAKEPWFLTCSLINPHDIAWYSRFDVPAILVPDVCDKLPDNWNDSLEGKPGIQREFQLMAGKILGTRPGRHERTWRHYIDFYYYLTRKVDIQIQKILDALDQLGLSDNTLVIFTADHGEMCGSHRLQGKGPFIYQENNHVPLVMRWPGRIKPGSETSALTHSPDFMPTLLELAGISANTSHLPGKSLVPLIRDPGKKGLHDHILMSFGFSFADDISRMFRLPPRTAPMGLRSIFDGRHKYARYFDIDVNIQEEYELYDLKNDPLEMRNLAGDPGYRAIQKEMADRLHEAEAKEMAAPSHDWPRIRS